MTTQGGSYSWNATCDVCGFQYKANELRKRWDGLMVCEADFETRHPMDFYRVRNDHHPLPFIRKDPDPVSDEITAFTEAGWRTINETYPILHEYNGTNGYYDWHWEYLTQDLDLKGFAIYLSPQDLNRDFEFEFSVMLQYNTLLGSINTSRPRSNGKGLWRPRAGWNKIYFADYNMANIQCWRGQSIQFGLRRWHTPLNFIAQPVIHLAGTTQYEFTQGMERSNSLIYFGQGIYYTPPAANPPLNTTAITTLDTHINMFMGVWGPSTLVGSTTWEDTGIDLVKETWSTGGYSNSSDRFTKGNHFLQTTTRSCTHLLMQAPTVYAGLNSFNGSLSLWDITAGSLIESVAIPSLTATPQRWYEVALTTPRTLTAGKTYAVSLWNNTNAPAPIGQAWDRATTLRRNGVYATNYGLYYAVDAATPTIPLVSTYAATTVAPLDIKTVAI